MAFFLRVNLHGMEYRGDRSGQGKSGAWLSLVFEDKEARQIEVSVPRDMHNDVYQLGLKKGDVCVITVNAVARNDGNSYVQLVALPEFDEDYYEGGE